MTEPTKLDDMDELVAIQMIDDYFDGKEVTLHPDDLAIIQNIQAAAKTIHSLYSEEFCERLLESGIISR